MAILETKSLTKSFGALTAVNGVSLAVEAGSLHSIIGPNGAGKTTLFNLLTGTFPPTSGQIIFDGRTSPARRRTASRTSASRAPSSAPPSFPRSRFSTTCGSPLLRPGNRGTVCCFKKTDELCRGQPGAHARRLRT